MRVAVIGGGISSEHEVSLRSAASVAAGLREAGHETVEVTIDRDGRWSAEGDEIRLVPAGGLLECDVAFPVLHGPGGEDGSVQGLLEVLDVPYAGSDVEASAICMDKLVFKDLLGRHGIPQVDYCRAGEPDWKAIASGFGQPVWVKPARLGSSVGISPASGEEELDSAVEQAARHDPRVIVEAPAPGKEVECSLLGNEDPVASPPGEIDTKGHDWYDYEAKYAEGGMELVVPARISDGGDGAPPRRSRGRSSPSAAAAGWPAATSSSTATRCSSTSSTPSPASPRPASTASSSRPTGSPIPSSATGW